MIILPPYYRSAPHTPPGTEGSKNVSASESAPATVAEAVTVRGWRSVVIVFDRHANITSGEATIYLSRASNVVPQAWQTHTLHATQRTELSFRLGGSAWLLSVRITTLVTPGSPTLYRTIILSQEDPP